jgi:hypothetical protein
MATATGDLEAPSVALSAETRPTAAMAAENST